MIKTSEYYYIDYQYVLVDREIYEGGSGGGVSTRGFSGVDERRLQDELNWDLNLDHPLNPFYFGRINRLQFKLCHEYCETCYELSTSNNEQKCESCLPKYQYDYLYFLNKTKKNPNNICVPEGKYYDTDNQELSKCSRHFKYYFNTTDNKKICFPNNDEYPCPSSYPIYNKTSK